MAPHYTGCHGHHSGERWTLLPFSSNFYRREKANLINARIHIAPPSGSGLRRILTKSAEGTASFGHSFPSREPQIVYQTQTTKSSV